MLLGYWDYMPRCVALVTSECPVSSFFLIVSHLEFSWYSNFREGSRLPQRLVCKIFGFEKGRESMAVEKSAASSSIVEVVDRILDKGVVIDVWVRISLVGIEILTIQARVVIASVETFLKYAEALEMSASGLKTIK